VTPHRWQLEALAALLAALRSGGSPLVYACTGAGKAYLLALLLREVLRTLRPGYVVVVVVPTKDLVRQLSDTLAQHIGEPVGVWYSDGHQRERVTVTCLPSLSGLVEELRVAELRTGLLVCDEAHRAEAYREVIAALAPRARCGVTATPYLRDGSLTLWSGVVYEYRIAQAQQDGVLWVPRVRQWSGGMVDADEATIKMLKEDNARRTIVTAADVADAERTAERLTGAGIPTLAVHSRMDTDERDRRRDALRADDIAALVHVRTLVEGIDWPWLEGIAIRHDIGSPVQWVQQVGRVLRLPAGKRWATVYDVLAQWARHGLSRDASLGDIEARGDGRKMTAAEARAVELERAVPLAVAVSDYDAWLVGVRVAAEGCGLLPPLPTPPPGSGGTAHLAPATRAQASAIADLAGSRRWLPDDVRVGVVAASEHPEAMTRGGAQTVIDLLRAAKSHAGREYARGTPWPRVRPVSVPGVPPLPDTARARLLPAAVARRAGAG